VKDFWTNMCVSSHKLLLSCLGTHIRSSLSHNAEKKEQKSKKECEPYFFIVLKLYTLEHQVPWIPNSSAIHKSYLYLLTTFPQEACLSHTVECCARTCAVFE